MYLEGSLTGIWKWHSAIVLADRPNSRLHISHFTVMFQKHYWSTLQRNISHETILKM